MGLLIVMLLGINIIDMSGVFYELNLSTTSLYVKKQDKKMKSPKRVGPSFSDTYAYIYMHPIQADTDLSKSSWRHAFLEFFVLK